MGQVAPTNQPRRQRQKNTWIYAAARGCTQSYRRQISPKNAVCHLYNINQVYSAQNVAGKYSVQQRLFNMHQALGTSCHSLHSCTEMFLPAGSLSKNSIDVRSLGGGGVICIFP